MLIIILLAIVAVLFIFINFLNKSELKKIFNNNNVIVFGKKGTGKDILFNYITNSRKFYYSNIPYTNNNYELITPNDLKLGKNTFENLLLNNIDKCTWQFKEKSDFFISDAGVYLPSQYDSILHKQYKGLPLFYALSRHIGLHNIHINTQNLERVWKALREQSDMYIKCLKTVKCIPGILILKYRIYDKYTSAVQDLRVCKNGFLFKSDTIKVHSANVGEIKEKWIIVSKTKTKYDSRYFKKVFITESD